jgi:hypothetical protein
MLWHEAALASGKLTRGSPGGQSTSRKSLCLGRDKYRCVTTELFVLIPEDTSLYQRQGELRRRAYGP